MDNQKEISNKNIPIPSDEKEKDLYETYKHLFPRTQIIDVPYNCPVVRMIEMGSYFDLK
jgi:hypothetical protein